MTGWRIKAAVQQAIARHRKSTLVLAMHRVASFIEGAWHNEGAAFASNGEKFVLEQLKLAHFRLAMDVGANVGDWAASALEQWQDCFVHAFEVAPETYKLLDAACHSSPSAGRVEAHSVGLSDQAGTQTLYYFPDHPTLTCDLPRRHEGYTSIPFDAALTTLDAFCGERGIGSIDYLKIDVEGAESRVLRGAAGLLAAGRISCIQFEYGAFSIDTHFLLKDFFDLLSDQYAIGKIFPNHVAFADYDWRTEDFRFANYLCVLKDRRDLLRLLPT